MSSPRTLPALRAAVARVLVARGEAADALVCEVEPQAGGVWHASILATTCGALIDWLAIGGGSRGEAVGMSGRGSAEIVEGVRNLRPSIVVLCRSISAEYYALDDGNAARAVYRAEGARRCATEIEKGTTP